MMKYFLLLLLLTVPACPLTSQAIVWNQGISASEGNIISLCKIQSYGEEYLFAAGKSTFEFDEQGSLRAAFPVEEKTIGDYVRPKTDPKTGNTYFLLGYRNFGQTGPIIMEEYLPGKGYSNKSTWPDVISTNTSSPEFFDLNDSTVLLCGRKFIRALTHRPGKGMVLLWQRPFYHGEVNAVIKLGDGYVLGTRNGAIVGLNAQFDSLWITQTNNVNIRNMVATPDGFWACGANSSGALLLRFSLDGQLEQQFPYLIDKIYHDLFVDTDGNLIIAGQSIDNEVAILRLGKNGNVFWRKIHHAGGALSILKAKDGGYLIGGFVWGKKMLFVMKTDADGNGPSLTIMPAINKRLLSNSVIEAPLGPSASLFYDETQETGFRAKETGANLVGASALWMGGIDPSGALLLSAATYETNNKSDFKPGFIHTRTSDFNRVWKVTRRQIETMRQDWADNGILDLPVPYDILSWPAVGNPDFTQNPDFSNTSTHPDSLPAPFVDANDDGRYNVRDGDFPSIKGDQMAWWALTDFTTHTQTYGRHLYMNIAVSAYLFDCPGSELERTLFVDFDIFHRSTIEIDSFFAGIWTDFSLGCPTDDYVGCLPEQNAYFVYNQDTLDGNPGISCEGEANTFAQHIPVASVLFRGFSYNKFMVYSNASPPPEAAPIWDVEYYHYLTGSWRDSRKPTFLGNEVDYLFYDNPSDPNGFSMCNYPPKAGDHLVIGSTGPFLFQYGQVFPLRMAYTYHPNIPHPCPDLSGSVSDDLIRIKDTDWRLEPFNLPPLVYLPVGKTVVLDAKTFNDKAYNWSTGSAKPEISVSQPGVYTVTITRYTGCTQVETTLVKSSTSTHLPVENLSVFQVFPNPSDGSFTLELQGTPQKEITFSLFNAIGQQVHQEVLGFENGFLTKRFHLSQLPTGIYALNVRIGRDYFSRNVLIKAD